jgi:signal peptidase II
MALPAASSPNTRLAALVRCAVVIALVVGLDQLTKRTVAAGIAADEQRKFLPLVKLVHVRNKGVAFGVFSSGGPLVLAFTIVALLALAGYLALRPTRPWLWLPTGLLIGGAIGNLVDRLVSGAVTDFIKLPLWPAFNVADIAITFGVLALLWVLEGGGST